MVAYRNNDFNDFRSDFYRTVRIYVSYLNDAVITDFGV